MIIRKVDISDLDQLISLITEFRRFYGQETNQSELRIFIKNRIDNKDSEIFVATIDGQLVGYTQLFPSFSMIKLCKIWILNDLFVSKPFRGKGVASELIETVLRCSKQDQRKQVWLLTGNDNINAQKLYLKKGFINTKFKHYVYNN